MKFVRVQVVEHSYGSTSNIDHPCNKEVEEIVYMAGDAKVKYALGMTISLPNYQSAKVEVGIELPCEVADIDKAYEDATNWVNDRYQEEVDSLVGLRKAMKGGN